jgi:hypothetical protein
MPEIWYTRPVDHYVFGVPADQQRDDHIPSGAPAPTRATPSRRVRSITPDARRASDVILPV